MENGADVNATDRNDDSHLIVATRHGKETAVRVLLELGATVGGGVAGNLGIAPHINILVQAANSLNISLLRMLLESVEKDQRAYSSGSKCRLIVQALFGARERGSDEATELLEQALERFDETWSERGLLDLKDTEWQGLGWIGPTRIISLSHKQQSFWSQTRTYYQDIHFSHLTNHTYGIFTFQCPILGFSLNLETHGGRMPPQSQPMV